MKKNQVTNTDLLYDMEISEQQEINGGEVTRVPGGWIFEMYSHSILDVPLDIDHPSALQPVFNHVFVPLPNKLPEKYRGIS